METIRDPSDIERVFREGKRGSHPLLVVLASDSPDRRDPHGRVVFIAGKKLGGAVFRNRCKRVLREAARRAGGPWPGKDVAIIARDKVSCARPEEVDEALRAALRRAGVAE